MIYGQRVVKKGAGDCKYKGGKICHGAVTEVSTFSVMMCRGGKIKKYGKVSGYPLVGRDTGPGKDCVWYGQTYCSGDTVIDLNRWKFVSKCGTGKMRPVGLNYNQIVKD